MSHFIDSYHLLSYDVVDSTNEEAKRLAVAGGQHGAVIWAKEQTKGKGRNGRSWESCYGNLFCSLLLQPHIDVALLPQLSFVTSLAVCQALQPIVSDEDVVSLKWPNDILLNNKKLSGILLESLQVDNSKERWVIIGIGVNISHYPYEGTHYPATSLKNSGIEIISSKIVLSRFLNCFEPLYRQWIDEGFSSIREQWVKLSAWHGQEVVLDVLDSEQVVGTYIDIDESGQIMIEYGPRKEICKYAAGDVRLRGA